MKHRIARERARHGELADYKLRRFTSSLAIDVRPPESGPNWYQTVMECQTMPTVFYKSRLAFNGNAWECTLKDGTVYIIGHAPPLPSIRIGMEA